MKIKLFLTALIGALAIQGVHAGEEWCPPDKTPMDDYGSYDDDAYCDECPDVGGQISLGYDTDYVWKGVRLARDVVWGDVNYTFANLPLSPNIGVWHLSSLGSGAVAGAPNYGGTDAYGDETNIYANVTLGGMFGIKPNIRYTHVFFPTTRGPGNPREGDSFGYVTISLVKEIFNGWNFGYSRDYSLGRSSSTYHDGGLSFGNLPSTSRNGFFHTFSLAKSFCLSDSVDLQLSGGANYNDNFWDGREFLTIGSQTGPLGNGPGPNRDAGWHNYYLRADLPIKLNCRATLTPYVAYNGTPDGWIADQLWAGPIGRNANLNDVFYGGVSLKVNF